MPIKEHLLRRESLSSCGNCAKQLRMAGRGKLTYQDRQGPAPHSAYPCGNPYHSSTSTGTSWTQSLGWWLSPACASDRSFLQWVLKDEWELYREETQEGIDFNISWLHCLQNGRWISGRSSIRGMEKNKEMITVVWVRDQEGRNLASGSQCRDWETFKE